MKRGFSLIELTVWIAVAGILVAAMTMLVGRSFSVSRFELEQVRTTDEARVQGERMAKAIRGANFLSCSGIDGLWLREAGPKHIEVFTNADDDKDVEKVRYELKGSELFKSVDQPSDPQNDSCLFQEGGEQILTRFASNNDEPLFRYYTFGSPSSAQEITGDELDTNQRQQVVRVAINLIVDVNPDQDPPPAQVGMDVTPRVNRTVGLAYSVLPSPSASVESAGQACSIRPMSGPPGTQVEISGTQIRDVQSVVFSDSMIVNSSGTEGPVYAEVPSGAVRGAVRVRTLNGDVVCPEFIPFAAEVDANSALVFVIDRSNSSLYGSVNFNVNDENGDSYSETILDAEVKSLINFNREIIGVGLGDEVKVGVIQFSGTASYMDLDPIGSGGMYTVPAVDADGNGERDVEEALRSVRAGGGDSTYYAPALSRSASMILNIAGQAPGKKTVFFITDGVPMDAVATFKEAARQVRVAGAEIRAIGVGNDPRLLGNLVEIDPCAQVVNSADSLLEIFQGGGTQCSRPRPSPAPILSQGCVPRLQQSRLEEEVRITASQFVGGMSWWAPQGDPKTGNGQEFITRFGTGGLHDVHLYWGAVTDTCQVNVAQSPLPSQPLTLPAIRVICEPKNWPTRISAKVNQRVVVTTSQEGMYYWVAEGSDYNYDAGVSAKSISVKYSSAGTYNVGARLNQYYPADSCAEIVVQ